MTLKQYVPFSIVLFVLMVAGVSYFGVPVLPFALILLAGETLLGFQVDDHRAGRFVKAIFGKK